MTPQEYNLYNINGAVDQYKYQILTAYTDYSRTVCNEIRTSLNRKYVEQLLLNIVILRLYIRIIIDYLTITMVNDTNLMAYIEFKQVMRNVNRIMNTNHILILT